MTFCVSWLWLDSLEAKLKNLSYTKLVINLAMPKSLTLIMELCLFHQSVHSLVLGVADVWNPTAATLLSPDGPSRGLPDAISSRCLRQLQSYHGEI